MDFKAKYTKDNYTINLKKDYEKNSILINCENKNNKKNYIAEYTSDRIVQLFEKSLDEAFNFLCEWFNGNNYFIEERNDEIIIKINDTNKEALKNIILKSYNYIVSSSLSNLSSIPNNTESRNIVDVSISNWSIPIFIPTNEKLNSSYINYYNTLSNLYQSNHNGNILTGLLKLCLLKKISPDLMEDNDVKILIKPEFINILSEIDKNIHLTYDSNQNLETMIKEKKAFNILSYSNYLDNSILNINIIKLLFNLKTEKKAENEKYWSYLSLFQEYTKHFEKTFIKDLKNCYFDYSLVSINCVLSDNLEENQKRNYKKKKILYHYSEINPISKIFQGDLEISNNPQDENNFYDNFEYFAFNFIKKKKKGKKEKKKKNYSNKFNFFFHCFRSIFPKRINTKYRWIF